MKKNKVRLVRGNCALQKRFLYIVSVVCFGYNLTELFLLIHLLSVLGR